MSRRIVNLDELQLQPLRELVPGAPSAFDARIGAIGERVGARQLGYNLTVVPPGKRAWPMHNHHNNEEMFFILSGEGELRLGDERHPLRSGDVIACPTGGSETAHQIINTGTAELRYLAVGTLNAMDVVEYPDSAKFGVRIELPAAEGGEVAVKRIRGRLEHNLDYWDGE